MLPSYLFLASFLMNVFLNPIAEATSPCLENVDYSDRFGPDRDQNGHGSCWMMAASGLFEEQNCIINPADCGKSISPFSASVCDFNLGKKKQGGHPNKAMDCMTKNGACLEEHAPYLPAGLFCKTIGALNGNGMKCGTESIKINLHRARAAKTAGSLRSALNRLWFSLPRQSDITAEELKASVSGDVSENDFLKRAFLPRQCQKNAIHIPNKKVVQAPGRSSYKVSELKEIFRKTLIDGLRGGTSVGISMDLGLIRGSNFEKNSPHAVIFNGMKFNKKTGQCEIKIKNSWGRGAKYHGWLPLKNILPAIYHVYHYGTEKSKPNDRKQIIQDSKV